jgi:hypothetical protein
MPLTHRDGSDSKRTATRANVCCGQTGRARYGRAMISVRTSLMRASSLGLFATCLATACADARSPLVLTPGDDGAPTDAGRALVDAGQPTWDARPNDAADDGSCGDVRVESEPGPGQVDVVWVIDDSPSMLPQVLPVGANMVQFMDRVRSGGGDISVVMVTGPFIGGSLATAIEDDRYHWLLQPVGSHDPFDWALFSYDEYKQYLRPGAALHFVFVSDDFSVMSGPDFITRMTTTHGGPFTVHAVATDGAPGPCLGFPPFAGGGAYYDAAEATGGEQLSLCGDWGAGFDELQENVQASLPLPCSYPIPQPPDDAVLDPDAVRVLFTASQGAAEEFARADAEDQCGDNLAFRFDTPSDPSVVLLCPAACAAVQKGGSIELGFGCAPSVILR